MPLSVDDRALLKETYGRLADKPLEPGSVFYEPVYEHLVDTDPVILMADGIEFSEAEGQSIRAFSGFRGTGKTTELLRLKKLMEERGYFVIYADALEYLNPSEPVEITDLLMALAGAFGEALASSALGVDISHETFWARLWNFLKNSEVDLKEIGLKGELDGPVKAGVELKFDLKTPSTFRQRLQEVLLARLALFKNEVDKFFKDGVDAIRRKRENKDKQVLFIFDQLEQFRGTLLTEQQVFASFERLFTLHLDMLRLPGVHVVYPVPPWLKFRRPGIRPFVVLPTPHLWNNDSDRTRCEEVWMMFRSLVSRRFGEDRLTRLFGEDQATRWRLVDKMIEQCGGHFRDLLYLLRETIQRAASLPSLPVPEAVVDNTIAATRRTFLPIAVEDAQWLEEIARRRSSGLKTLDPKEVNRLTRFLDTHFVLYFVNDEDWYDIHPLIRNEVDAVVRSSVAAETA